MSNRSIRYTLFDFAIFLQTVIAKGTDLHASLSNIHVSSARTPESGALYVAMHLCSGPAPVAAPIC